MDEKEFMENLKNKTINMVRKCGPIIDVIHNRDNDYFVVENIINFIIDYFMEKK